MEGYIGDYRHFLASIVERCEDKGIDIERFSIDHICYRCESLKEYSKIKKEMLESKLASLLGETMIGGRPISVFQCIPKLQFRKWEVDVIELASPKAGRYYKSGLEHCEVVIGSEESEMFDSSSLFQDFMSKYSHLSFDLKSAHKSLNADISLPLTPDISIKFHARPLRQVCIYELNHNLIEPVPDSYFC